MSKQVFKYQLTWKKNPFYNKLNTTCCCSQLVLATVVQQKRLQTQSFGICKCCCLIFRPMEETQSHHIPTKVLPKNAVLGKEKANTESKS